VVHLSIDIDREDDGRWIAEALELPGVMTYGQTREDAIRKRNGGTSIGS
jgi:predicted RNase H-like HicB family nuclease